MRAAWRGRNQASLVDAYFRWTLYLVPWFSVLAATAPVMSRTGGPLPTAMAYGALGLDVILLCLTAPLLERSLRKYLGQGPVPHRLMIAFGALTLAAEAALCTLRISQGPRSADDIGSVLVAAAAVLTPFLMAYSLLVSKRVFFASLGGAIAGVVLLTGLATGIWLGGVVLAILLFAAALWSLVISRPSGWILAVFRELDRARATQARLAVAEERLRFGRDLHDVMGRNLAVIALKSELAVQLARRERPEAVEQMVEVQRIAQESQREVREVVRGYRKADLQAELAGARAILRAAGIGCLIEGEEGRRLSAEVQSALGWVVREGTTNVLRHAAQARRCVLRTRVDERAAVLVMTMENDGVAPVPESAATARPGSGLKGLRERLHPLGGTLESGPVPKDSYRLTVELPLGAGPAEGMGRHAGAETGAGTGRPPGARHPAGAGHPTGVRSTAEADEGRAGSVAREGAE